MRHTLYSLVKEQRRFRSVVCDRNTTGPGLSRTRSGHDRRDDTPPAPSCQGVMLLAVRLPMSCRERAVRRGLPGIECRVVRVPVGGGEAR
jgi:hypothetical protein